MALQNVDTPLLFSENADGRVEEKWWLPLISEDMRKLQQRVRGLEELIPLDDPSCLVPITSHSLSERTVTTMLELAIPQSSGAKVVSSVPPLNTQVLPLNNQTF